MKTRLMILATLFLSVVSAATLAAHHDVEAKFDSKKEVTVTGIVAQVLWANPHAAFVIDVREAGGKVVTWQVEVAPPHLLSNIGVTRDTVAVSSSVTVKMWPARDGSHTATGRMLTLPNGKQLNVGDALGWKQLPQDV